MFNDRAFKTLLNFSNNNKNDRNDDDNENDLLKGSTQET